jgi:maleylpyruvate isomerase
MSTIEPRLSLHGYFRSSAAYRVRIALNLKGLDYRHIGVHLLRGGGEQLTPEFRRINPQSQLPVLHEGRFSLTQSIAIIEYLEERYPEVALLPGDIEQRARARQFALTVACDIHPLNNPRVLKMLVGRYGIDEAGKLEWIRHWIEVGFTALEEQLQSEPGAGRFCVGDRPSIADCCLIPQVFNAVRFGVEMSAYPRIGVIAGACQALPAFRKAHPSQQPDAE